MGNQLHGADLTSGDENPLLEAPSSSDPGEDDNDDSSGSDAEWVMADGAEALLGSPGPAGKVKRGERALLQSLQGNGWQEGGRKHLKLQSRSNPRVRPSRKRAKGKQEPVFASASDYADILENRT